jgi:hypothetical protein
MKYERLMPGTEVRDDDMAGTVAERYTTRNERGPHREITVRYPGGNEAVYVNEEIERLEPLA